MLYIKHAYARAKLTKSSLRRKAVSRWQTTRTMYHNTLVASIYKYKRRQTLMNHVYDQRKKAEKYWGAPRERFERKM